MIKYRRAFIESTRWKTLVPVLIEWFSVLREQKLNRQECWRVLEASSGSIASTRAALRLIMNRVDRRRKRRRRRRRFPGRGPYLSRTTRKHPDPTSRPRLTVVVHAGTGGRADRAEEKKQPRCQARVSCEIWSCPHYVPF